MTSVPILIGGAAGATGSVATKLLLQMGFPVRAIVRGDDERARPLRALGAEVFVADLLDLRAVRRAFQ
jgi:NAD(P)H dehydrogenase (quinone)